MIIITEVITPLSLLKTSVPFRFLTLEEVIHPSCIDKPHFLAYKTTLIFLHIHIHNTPEILEIIHDLSFGAVIFKET